MAIPGDVVESAKWNNQNDDWVNSLNAMVQLDGKKAATGDWPMGTHKITGLGDGTAAQDAAATKQVQTLVVGHATAVAGTADAIQITMSPASTTLTTWEIVRWTSGGANTVVAPTLSKDAGSTNKTIKKGASAALAVGDTGASGYENYAQYNGTDWILLNPAISQSLSAATAVEYFTGTDTTKYLVPSTASLSWKKSADVASATTTTFLDDGGYVHITGTTTITDLDFTTATNGRAMKVVFDGILTLTHNSTTLVLPGGANITTAAGDTAEFVQDAADNIKCLWYQRADGRPVVSSGTVVIDIFGPTAITGAPTFKIDSSIITQAYKKLELIVNGISSSSSTGATDAQFRISGNNGTGYGTLIDFSTDNIANASTSLGIIEIYDAAVASGVRPIRYSNLGGTTANLTSQSITTGYINAIELSVTNGNIDAGTYTLIGYR